MRPRRVERGGALSWRWRRRRPPAGDQNATASSMLAPRRNASSTPLVGVGQPTACFVPSPAGVSPTGSGCLAMLSTVPDGDPVGWTTGEESWRTSTRYGLMADTNCDARCGELDHRGVTSVSHQADAAGGRLVARWSSPVPAGTATLARAHGGVVEEALGERGELRPRTVASRCAAGGGREVEIADLDACWRRGGWHSATRVRPRWGWPREVSALLAGAGQLRAGWRGDRPAPPTPRGRWCGWRRPAVEEHEVTDLAARAPLVRGWAACPTAHADAGAGGRAAPRGRTAVEVAGSGDGRRSPRCSCGCDEGGDGDGEKGGDGEDDGRVATSPAGPAVGPAGLGEGAGPVPAARAARGPTRPAGGSEEPIRRRRHRAGRALPWRQTWLLRGSAGTAGTT